MAGFRGRSGASHEWIVSQSVVALVILDRDAPWAVRESVAGAGENQLVGDPQIVKACSGNVTSQGKED